MFPGPQYCRFETPSKWWMPFSIFTKAVSCSAVRLPASTRGQQKWIWPFLTYGHPLLWYRKYNYTAHWTNITVLVLWYITGTCTVTMRQMTCFLSWEYRQWMQEWKGGSAWEDLMVLADGLLLYQHMMNQRVIIVLLLFLFLVPPVVWQPLHGPDPFFQSF